MTTNFLLIEQSDLDGIRDEIRALRQLIKNGQTHSVQWISSSDVPNYLGISRRTWQNYRDKKLIPFSQVGRKIWVKLSDLEAFIESCCIQGQISNKK